MDTNAKLAQLLRDSGWTTYRLAVQSRLSESTIANIFKRNTVPSIPTLEAICGAFGITLAQFFAEGDLVEMTPDLRELFDSWVGLSPAQKKAALQVLRAMNQ